MKTEKPTLSREFYDTLAHFPDPTPAQQVRLRVRPRWKRVLRFPHQVWLHFRAPHMQRAKWGLRVRCALYWAWEGLKR